MIPPIGVKYRKNFAHKRIFREKGEGLGEEIFQVTEKEVVLAILPKSISGLFNNFDNNCM